MTGAVRLLAVWLTPALWLAMPALMFSSYGADRRLLIMVALVLLASLDVRLESTRLCTGLAVAVLLLFLTRMSVIGGDPCDRSASSTET